MKIPLTCYSSMRIFSLLIFLQSLAIAEMTHTNTKLGYSIQLPDNWHVINSSDSQDVFYNVTSDGKTYLSVVYHSIEESTTESDWTKFHFIMYLNVTEEWEDPWGTVLAIDSSQSSMVNETWAPQAFAQFLSSDSVNQYWSEYILFTAKNHYGYELYAIGDTMDLKTNGDYYSQILHSISFFKPSPILKNRINKNYYKELGVYDKKRFDLFGRTIPDNSLIEKNTMIIIKNKSININNLR